MSTPKESSFWCVAPIAVIKDDRLSQGAKILYFLVTSLQNEKGYCFASNAYLAQSIGGKSEDTVQRSLRELIKCGYLAVEQEPGVERRIYPTVRIPHVDNTPRKNAVPPPQKCGDTPRKNAVHNIIDNNILPPKAPQGGRKRSENKKQPDHKPDRFKKFWEFYPRKESKQAAIRAWDRLSPSDALIDAMAKALKRQKQTEDWKRGIGVPYASTWLNNARWEDELPTQLEEDHTPRQEYISDDSWAEVTGNE